MRGGGRIRGSESMLRSCSGRFTRSNHTLLIEQLSSMQEEAAKPTRGTRPFEVIVPGKPWTSQFLSVDDMTARQSRPGANAQRYRDGTFRPDRPLPPGYSRPGQQPAFSPRSSYKRPDVTWFWDDPNTSIPTVPTTKSGYKPPYFDSGSPRPAPPKRHELSPRFGASTVGGIIFGDERYQKFSDRAGLIAMPHLESDEPAASPRSNLGHRADWTNEQRLRHLQIALNHERRVAETASNNLKTKLRAGIIVDPVGLHEPAGRPA